MKRVAAALRWLFADDDEPVKLPRTVGWGTCEDCDAPCLLTENGACATCGGSSTRPWQDRESAWRAAGCPQAEPVQPAAGATL